MHAMPLQRPPVSRVDTASRASLSFARPDDSPAPVTDRGPIAVGPGAAGIAAARREALRDDADAGGIQLGKVQSPVLRPETLERPRLLEWLRAKVNGRVVLLIADAGYGKTTLLADFSRRSRLRTLWYRLDETDRDWTSFIRHLVAAGREHDPAFAPRTAALLAESGVGGPSRETVLDAFIRELPSIAADGAILVFDDFHLVDDAVDVKHVARELVQRAPERLTFVFASRRQPTIPLSRLRAIGEVAELVTDDLRFDAAETAKLFTETYGRPVEIDVLADLARRTEGWVASLQLVQAALRDRTPAEIRRFVRTLNGADHEMYDYLAEEVVGDLDDELKQFLMFTSVLQVVTPELAQGASERCPEDVARLTLAAERLTLLSRVSGGPRTHLRYHPLVREFLEARLHASGGAEVVADVHLRAARSTADWRVAAHHYREAGATDEMLSAVAANIPVIMSNGQHLLADEFIASATAASRPAVLNLVISRVEMQRRDYEAAAAASRSVLAEADEPAHRDYALLNLVTLSWNRGDHEEALGLAQELANSTGDINLRHIAELTRDLLAGSSDGNVAALERKLRKLADGQRGIHRYHYGVSMLNLANLSWLLDRPEQALRDATEAAEALETTSGLMERATAVATQVLAVAARGDWEAYGRLRVEFDSGPRARADADSLIEIADATSAFLDPDDFDFALRGITTEHLSPPFAGLLACVAARAFARRGMHDEARRWLDTHPNDWGTMIGSRTEFLFTEAYVRAAATPAHVVPAAHDALGAAKKQQTHRWRHLTELLIAAHGSSRAFSSEVVRTSTESPWSLTYLADLVVPRLDLLDDAAYMAIARVAQVHPGRWRHDLRRAVDADASAVSAARLLDAIGQREDIGRLRRFARLRRRPRADGNVGRSLARRLAERVFVDDQGRVLLRIGERTVLGSQIRRKVLALLCFLLSRPDMSATRDQVLDALWPDLDPAVAVNSLNQTLYFLRRVFEEDYVEDLSPGYVNHDSEVIWLDPDLVTSRSSLCGALIKGIARPPAPDDVKRLVDLYHGRFALDFEYEEWAAGYRDTLHAAYLEIVERAVQDDIVSGHLDRGISNARRVLQVDAGADQIEVSLLRLYRAAGAYSAASEQYAHYAARVREDLGVEPPSLDALVG